MARAMPTRWRCPPDNASARRGRETGQSDRIKQIECARNILGRKFTQPRAPGRDIAEPTAEQVLHHGQAFDQIVFLEHHPDSPPGIAKRAPRKPGEILSPEQDLPRSRLHQPIDATDQRALAGAGRTDNGRQSRSRQHQIDPVEDGRALAIFLGEPAQHQRARIIRWFRPRRDFSLHHGFFGCSAFCSAFFLAASASRAASFS